MKKISMSRTRCRNENIIEATNEDFKVSMLNMLKDIKDKTKSKEL